MNAYDAPTLADKLRALRDPAAYSPAVAGVDLIETHFAAVALAGEFAYKLKKPVQVERMDFRNLAAREHSCREEVRLNKRLAPQVYLDVVPLCLESNGTLRVSGTGHTVEWLVKMRRLPAESMLDRAIASGTLMKRGMQAAALWLAQFFRDQPPTIVSGADYLARLYARVDDAREQLLARDLELDPAPIETAYERQQRFLAAHGALVRHRATAGRIVEGHGDLRPEHVCLGSASPPFAPCVIDCLEFDRDLRIFDPIEELAFLSLECERMRATWVGKEFIKTYRAITQDRFTPQLFAFYRTQRALTRAKIAAWHLRDDEVRDLSDWRTLAHGYLYDALAAKFT